MFQMWSKHLGNSSLIIAFFPGPFLITHTAELAFFFVITYATVETSAVMNTHALAPFAFTTQDKQRLFSCLPR